MSESEIQAVIDEQARKKQEADRKFWVTAAVLKVRLHDHSNANAI